MRARLVLTAYLGVVLGAVIGLVVPPVRADSKGDRAKQLEKLTKKLVKDKDTYSRRDAARQLGEMGGPEAVTALTGALKDPASEVRVGVVDALATIGGAEVVNTLEGALNDSSEDVRAAVVERLARLSGAEAASALAAALKDRSPDVRVAAAVALVHFKDPGPDVVAPLKAALSDTESLVRYNVLAALSNMNATTPDMAPVLAAFLRDRDAATRRQCLRILIELGAGHEEVRTALSSAFAQGDPSVRREVLAALGEEGAIAGSESWAKQVVAGLAKTDPDPEVRSSAQTLVTSISEFLKSPGYLACRFVTPDEAAAVLGPRPRLSPTPHDCYYIAADRETFQLVIATESNGGLFPERLARIKQAGTTQDEPAFPKGSFSRRKQDNVDYFVMGKTTYLHVSLLAGEKAHNEVPPELYPKLRDLVKKAATRFNQ